MMSGLSAFVPKHHISAEVQTEGREREKQRERESEQGPPMPRSHSRLRGVGFHSCVFNTCFLVPSFPS
jgi:hypothetical protein